MKKLTETKKPVIICVDDEVFFLLSLRLELTNLFANKVTVEIAESADEALTLINNLIKEGFDIPIIMSDYMMPGMKGDSFLKEAHSLLPNSKKILLSGMATIEAVRNSLNWSNLFRYMLKPWDGIDLKLTLTEAFRLYFKERLIEVQQNRIANLNANFDKEVMEVSKKIIEQKEIEFQEIVISFNEVLAQTLHSLLQILFKPNDLVYKKINRLIMLTSQIISHCEINISVEIKSCIIISYIYLTQLEIGLVNKIFLGSELNDDERSLIRRSKLVVYRIFNKIPYLNTLALLSNSDLDSAEIIDDLIHSKPIENIAEIKDLIAVAFEFDKLIQQNIDLNEAINIIRNSNLYPERYFEALNSDYIITNSISLNGNEETIKIGSAFDKKPEKEKSTKKLSQLRNGMIIAENIIDLDGAVIVIAGQTVNDDLLLPLLNFSTFHKIAEPIYVYIDVE